LLKVRLFDVHQVVHFDLQLKEVTLVAGCLTSSDMVFKAIAIAFNLKLKLFLTCPTKYYG
jgi:hypothetical protein